MCYANYMSSTEADNIFSRNANEPSIFAYAMSIHFDNIYTL